MALEEVAQQVEEDAAITSLSLENAQDTAGALGEQYELANKLAAIMQDRLKARLDDELEMAEISARRNPNQAGKDAGFGQRKDMRGHLSQITGIPGDELEILPESIPTISADAQIGSGKDLPESPGIAAAALNSKAKEQRAHGDAQYTWRPQVAFSANYGRISPINGVQSYYNLNGNYNAATAGVSIQLPILDKVRKQAAKQSGLDAARSAMDLDSLRSDEIANRHKLARSLPELQAKAELAEIDYEIAQDELRTAEVKSHQDMGAPPITPKEVENAHIEERQKYVDMLDARLEERKAQITFLRLTGQLDSWLKSTH